MAKYKKLNIHDFNKFSEENKRYKDGVFTLQLTSWDEFHSVVKIFNNNNDYFWRGQKDECPLLSSFDRDFSNNNNRKETLKRMFNNLKCRLNDLNSNIDSLNPNEIWAIGQHYGLPTPLLDWTESPYIAAYFALYKKSNRQNNRAIYALNKALKLLIKGDDRFVEFNLPNNNFDPMQNQRLINQKGKFTIALEGRNIKSILGKFWEKTRNKNKYLNEIILAEILIPDKSRDECLSVLRAMNITHGMLFPDNAGAVEICKIDLGLGN